MRSFSHFDIIGDVHGHQASLQTLLEKLGYSTDRGVWQHPERQAIFVGDLIDKGPDPAGVLTLVRDMVEAGTARMVVGNHELNWVRDAHAETGDIRSFVHATREHYDRIRLVSGFSDDIASLRTHFDWLRRQPLFIDEPGLRVVHACWNDTAIACLKAQGINRLDAEGMRRYSDAYSEVYLAIDLIVAGCEHECLDHTSSNGFRSLRRRVRWWPTDHACINPLELQPTPAKAIGYPETASPVFFGHYALVGTPTPLGANVAGVDYSAAYEGALVAYRHTPGVRLSSDRFVSVPTTGTPTHD
ncbi:metallophosphoesterase [Vreelandella rituensis]|nr:metallophosphoesterase [Halomonas rituensis]